MADIAEAEKIAAALKAAGVVVPADLTLPGKIGTELSKHGITLGPDWGGLVLTHVLLVWRN